MAAVAVTSTKSVDFPSLNWGITAGDKRELPEDKEAQNAILAHPAISKLKSSKEANLTD